MSLSLQSLRCFGALPSSPLSSSPSNQCDAAARPVRISCCSGPAFVREAPPSPIKPLDVKEDKRTGPEAARPGIKVPRQKYISISKSELLDAIISAMFASQHEQALQFLSLSQCLDSILHAEHKTILEEMRADFGLTRPAKKKSSGIDDDFPSIGRTSVADDDSGAFLNGSVGSDKTGRDEDEVSCSFTLDWKQVMDFSLRTAMGAPIKSPSVAIPGRFQHAFMKLLYNAGFEELSPRDLMLTSALNTDYLLTLPVYVDWKKASESSAIIFRKGRLWPKETRKIMLG